MADLHMLICHHRPSVVDNDDRSANSSRISRNMDRLLMSTDVYTDKLGYLACTPQCSELGDEILWVSGQANQSAIQRYNVRSFIVELAASQGVEV